MGFSIAIAEILCFSVGYIPPSLKEAGFVEGQNVIFGYRWTESQFDRLLAMAAELAQRKVSVMIAGGSPLSALAAKAATTTVTRIAMLVNPTPPGIDAQKAGLQEAAQTLGLALQILEVSREAKFQMAWQQNGALIVARG